MAYVTPYCELSFANSINVSDEWEDAETSDKDMALVYGRLFIDQSYTCDDTDWDTSDYSTIPEEVQRSNAILAEMYIQGVLFPDSKGASGPVTKKRVKAGSVESETTYLGFYAAYTKTTDQKPEITMLLSPYCSFGSNKDLIRV